jgi:hypothetical protein
MSLSRIEVITGMSKFSSLKAALSKTGADADDIIQFIDKDLSISDVTGIQLFLDDLYDGIHTLRFHNNIDLLFWKQFHLFELIHFILSGSFFHTASKYLHHGHSPHTGFAECCF